MSQEGEEGVTNQEGVTSEEGCRVKTVKRMRAKGSAGEAQSGSSAIRRRVEQCNETDARDRRAQKRRRVEAMQWMCMVESARYWVWHRLVSVVESVSNKCSTL